MSRSGYSDDYDDDNLLHLYRGRVASATRGKRGQALLHDLVAALDIMPEKRLISKDLKRGDGSVCALGAVADLRGVKDISLVDPEDADLVAHTFDIAECLAREVVFENDENGERHEYQPCSKCFGLRHMPHNGYWSRCYRCNGTGTELRFRDETPEERWQRMRAWAVYQIKKDAVA